MKSFINSLLGTTDSAVERKELSHICYYKIATKVINRSCRTISDVTTVVAKASCST